jgi:hypothetical protein
VPDRAYHARTVPHARLPARDVVTRLLPPRADEIAVECHGTRIRVRSSCPELLDGIKAGLPPGAKLTERTRAHVFYRVLDTTGDDGEAFTVLATRHGRDEGGRIATCDDVTSAIEAVLQDLEFRVALHAPEHVFIHAGAVEWEGRAIIVPGTSHSGKSTLTAALVSAGAHYLSDEFAVLDQAGLVIPFPRPMQLREGNGVRRVRVEGATLSERYAVPLGVVAFTWYERASRWQPQPMTSGRTALALLENAVIARTRSKLAMTRIARALEHGGEGLRGPRGEAHETARAILDWASRRWRGSDPQ